MARVLLAEDDDLMRGFLFSLLTSGGHAVCALPNGEAAWAAFEAAADAADTAKRCGGVATGMPTCRFDIVVSDIVMPGMDGIELVRRVKERDPDVATIFITGFAGVILTPEPEADPHRANVLGRPFHLRDLAREVDRLFAAPPPSPSPGGRAARFA
jgi:two-component system cell cycle response regulator CpdR